MGYITIAFDDGYKDTFMHCAGFLRDKGVPATFAAAPSFLGAELENRAVIDEKDILSLEKAGHEIASHTLTHKNLLDVLLKEGEPAVKNEMDASKTILTEVTGNEIHSMVFPFIDANNNRPLRTLASNYYKSSRITSEKIVFNRLPFKDPYSITGTAFTLEQTLAQMNEIAEMVRGRDLWLIEVFHLISENNTKSAHRDELYRFFTHIDIFKKHIDHILRKKIAFITQGEMVRKFYAH